MDRESTCLALIRHPDRASNAGLAARSAVLFHEIVEPEARANGFRCIQVDPAHYGVLDERLFRLLESADVVVVDAAAESMDYMYSLGVRHALTCKPTFVLVESDSLPFDLRIPEGVFYVKPVILDSSDIAALRSALRQELRQCAGPREISYSPVRAALEKVPRVFLSYAHADRESVAAVDQWLRDREIRVDIDERSFVAGRDIRDEIVSAIQRAGKVVCFYSQWSQDRYYPKLERRLSEEAERQATGRVVLVYFRLDDTTLPPESAHRLAINAWSMGFEYACGELLRHLLEKPAEVQRISLAQYRRRAPWQKSGQEGDDVS